MPKERSHLQNYLARLPPDRQDSAVIAYLATLDHLQRRAPELAQAILQEIRDQRTHIKLIASENYSSLTTQISMGNLLTDKYSEGYVGHRFYAGCENVDSIEKAAIEELKSIFSCDHAYVQPHSGTDANLIAFWAILVKEIQNKEIEKLGKKSVNTLSPEEYETIRQLMVNQKIMGLALDAGGHLTHGYRQNLSGKMFRSVPYSVDPKTEVIDYATLAKEVAREKPRILLGGYSAYPRRVNFAKMREIADSVGAVLLVDMAHFSGLVAGGAMRGEYDPIPHAHIVTSTTHKTLRGPRGGFILCQREFREVVDRGCPLAMGGALPHIIGAKFVAFKEAKTAEFRDYAQCILANAKALAQRLLERGVRLVTGGTDNHLIVLDTMASFSLTGLRAEVALRKAHMTVNRNAIPFDANGPWYTSGIRIGTAAMTTLGMRGEEMVRIADLIADLLQAVRPAKGKGATEVAVDARVEERIKRDVSDLLARFPLYPELIV